MKKARFHVLSLVFTFLQFEWKTIESNANRAEFPHCLSQIKVLTTDWYVTLAGAEYSQVLEVNDERTKVRRVKPLPKWLLCSPTSKLLLVYNISAEESKGDGLEHCSLSERLLQKVSAHGDAASVRILQPGKELPKELQCYAKRHRELGQHLCAVLKFDHLDTVRKAYRALKTEEEKSNGEGLCVVPLGFQSVQHNSKDEPSEENKEDQTGKSRANPLATPEDSLQEEPSSPVKVSDETPGTSQPQAYPDKCMQRTFEQTSASFNDKTFTGLTQRYSRRSWCSGDCDKENSQSPWVLKRKFAASASNTKVHLNRPPFIQRVLRQPFGPDGTEGFRSRHRVSALRLNNSGEFMEQQYTTPI